MTQRRWRCLSDENIVERATRLRHVYADEAFSAFALRAHSSLRTDSTFRVKRATGRPTVPPRATCESDWEPIRRLPLAVQLLPVLFPFSSQFPYAPSLPVVLHCT